MTKGILVAYATRYGSTREVAEAVAATFREEGADVTVKPAREVATVNGHTAIVVGAPLYLGAWHRDAFTLLSRHREALVGVPVALFALGPMATDEDELRSAGAQFEKTLAALSWLELVASRVFCGKYDPAKLRFADRIIAALPASPLHGASANDARDWPAIRTWAKGLVGQLR